MIDLQSLKEILHYDESTGIFTWKKHYLKSWVGKQAGFYRKNDGVSIIINKKYYLAHRLAWFYVHGRWPTNLIDHIDRNHSNNKIDNLREATHSQNSMNAPGHCRSGYKNVSFQSDCNKWSVAIRKDHKIYYKGGFDTAEEANEFAKMKREELHGEFACHDVIRFTKEKLAGEKTGETETETK